jgi:hypothetical protein
LKPQSAKAKGRRLQQAVRDHILAAFPSLAPGDVRSASMGAPGADLQLSPAAMELFPFSVECKNREGINIWTALAQADRDPGLTPLLVFQRNNTQAYAAIPFSAFLMLVKRASLVGNHGPHVLVVDEAPSREDLIKQIDEMLLEPKPDAAS